MVAMATETVKPGLCDYSDSIKATYFLTGGKIAIRR